jgi:hypothetical protein
LKRTILGVMAALVLIVTGRAEAPAAIQTGSSPLDPAPIGKTVAGIIECGRGYTSHELYDMKITLLEVVRGEEAWKRIKDASASNKPAPAGSEYVLARVRFEFFARGTPGLCIHELNPGQFMAYSADGADYKSPSVVPPKPEMHHSLHSGESWEGWAAFLVPQQDKKPLMSYSADAGAAILHGGGRWFALY